MNRFIHAVLVICWASLGSCSSTPSRQGLDVESLESLEHIDVVYTGALSDEGLPERGQHAASEMRAEIVTVSCRIYRLHKEHARLFGDSRAWLRADRVLREDADSLFADLEETCGLAPGGQRSENPIITDLSLSRGGRANLEVVKVTAFVESYKIESLGFSTIADPVVGSAREGFTIEVDCEKGIEGSPLALSLRLHFARLQRPISEASAQLPGSRTQVTIQRPLFAMQQLELQAELNPGEALILGPVAPSEGDGTLIIVLTPEASRLESLEG